MVSLQHPLLLPFLASILLMAAVSLSLPEATLVECRHAAGQHPHQLIERSLVRQVEGKPNQHL
jgi:hypothetical protein